SNTPVQGPLGQAGFAGNLISGNGGGVAGSTLLGFGIQILSDQNQVQSNYIGVDATGTKALPNRVQGIRVAVGANFNTIGGVFDQTRNIISGNGQAGLNNAFFDGILLSGSANLIEGNYIGTDKTGTAAIPNGNNNTVAKGSNVSMSTDGGILIDQGTGNTI